MTTPSAPRVLPYHRPGASTAGLLAAAAVAAPALVGVAYAALAALGLAGAGARGFTLERLTRVLSAPATFEGLLWTLWVAAVATTLATIAGGLIAVAFRGTQPLDRAGRTTAVLPLPVPYVVAAVCGVLILGQSGLLARIAYAAGVLERPAQMPALVYDRAGLGFILTMAWKELPFLALVASSVLATRGVALEETARTLGATPRAAFLRVTAPLLWRGMMPAAVAAFTFAAGSYEVAALLAPSDPLALPLQILERSRDPALELRGDAYALALVAFAVAAAAVVVHEVIRRRWSALET